MTGASSEDTSRVSVEGSARECWVWFLVSILRRFALGSGVWEWMLGVGADGVRFACDGEEVGCGVLRGLVCDRTSVWES